jgi:hypothetical protein
MAEAAQIEERRTEIDEMIASSTIEQIRSGRAIPRNTPRVSSQIMNQEENTS